MPRGRRPPPWWSSSKERRRHARVDRDEQPGGEGQVAAGQREDRRGNVLWEHLFLQQRALGVERAKLLLGDAVDGGALRAPAAGEDAGAADHAVRVDAVDADADRAELGGQQADLVRLV